METSASFLENECYNKYGKSGKSFYYSQVASKLRWLSTATYTELTKGVVNSSSSPSKGVLLETELPSVAPLPPLMDQEQEANTEEELLRSVGSQTSSCASPNIGLPLIPSFSEFINSKKVKDNLPMAPIRHSSERIPKNVEKRMRLQ